MHESIAYCMPCAFAVAVCCRRSRPRMRRATRKARPRGDRQRAQAGDRRRLRSARRRAATRSTRRSRSPRRCRCVEPQSSGIGGGGLFLLHRASDGKDDDDRRARNRAGGGRCEGLSRRERQARSRQVAQRPAVRRRFRASRPAWSGSREHYGKLPLAKSLAPAIRIARDGFQPDARFLGELARAQGRDQALSGLGRAVSRQRRSAEGRLGVQDARSRAARSN